MFLSTFPFCCSQDNWDDEDEDEEKKAEVTKTGTNNILTTSRGKITFCFLRVEMFYILLVSEPKVSDKKKLMEKIKEKENRLKKKQEDLKKSVEAEVCSNCVTAA